MTADLFGGSVARVLTVGELTRAIRGALETKFGAVWVQGEISNYKKHPSGHQYFTLKDQRAQIACVIFRNTLPPSHMSLADGAQVQVYGGITVFEARGQYQLSVQIVQARGAGLLQAKFEALKRKLEAEGLFDHARKRPLPRFPQRIGIITSPAGAAIRDMLNVLTRRAPHVQILVSPVRVQGTGAAAEIATAIHELSTPNENWQPLDVIVIARGGGSIEDLWEFNEEIVARAIVASPVPIVSAIGHEVDFTIADFAADLRAPTPSAAAELIVPDTADVLRRISELEACLQRNWQNFAEQARARLRHVSERALGREITTRMRDAQQQLDLARDAITRAVFQQVANRRTALTTSAQTVRAHSPHRELLVRRKAVDEIQRRLSASAVNCLRQKTERFGRLGSMLRLLGPAGTLERGYSITLDSSGKVIASRSMVGPSMTVRTQLRDGEFRSVVADD